MRWLTSEWVLTQILRLIPCQWSNCSRSYLTAKRWRRKNWSRNFWTWTQTGPSWLKTFLTSPLVRCTPQTWMRRCSLSVMTKPWGKSVTSVLKRVLLQSKWLNLKEWLSKTKSCSNKLRALTLASINLSQTIWKSCRNNPGYSTLKTGLVLAKGFQGSSRPLPTKLILEVQIITSLTLLSLKMLYFKRINCPQLTLRACNSLSIKSLPSLRIWPRGVVMTSTLRVRVQA
jgi:hypothetical protein